MACPGPNGAGKTTVFYTIAGLIKLDEGRVTIDGYDVSRLPMDRLARLGVGYPPREASIFRGPSAGDNIMAVLEMTFNNGAVVTRDGGMSATFQTATAYMKQQPLLSKTPVTVRLHESTINADTTTPHWGGQYAVFEGKVHTHIERQPAQAPPGKPAGRGNGAGSAALGK